MSIYTMETKFKVLHEENKKYWPDDLKKILAAVGDFLDEATVVEKQAFGDNIRLKQRECQIARLEMLEALSPPDDSRIMKAILESRDEFKRKVQNRLRRTNYRMAFQIPNTYRENIIRVYETRPNPVWNPEYMANFRLEGFLLEDCEL